MVSVMLSKSFPTIHSSSSNRREVAATTFAPLLRRASFENGSTAETGKGTQLAANFRCFFPSLVDLLGWLLNHPSRSTATARRSSTNITLLLLFLPIHYIYTLSSIMVVQFISYTLKNCTDFHLFFFNLATVINRMISIRNNWPVS